MIEWIEKIDQEIFLFLNSLHTNWLDPIMELISGKWVWIPFYLFLIILLVRAYKWNVLWLLLAVAIGITVSDQITSGFMKPFFERLRPSRDPSLEGLVHIVNGYRGGMYGFASSHASNTFFIASFLFLSLRSFHPTLKWLFLWSIIVSYSRIYLGVHYFLDVLTGALVGTSIAFLLYYILLRWQKVKGN